MKEERWCRAFINYWGEAAAAAAPQKKM